MGDDYEHWRKKDIERGQEAIDAISWWWCYLRHSSTESIANENAQTENLRRVLLRFIEDRLGGVPLRLPVELRDELTVVNSAFIESVLRDAIPAYGDGVYWRPLDGQFWLPSQRDAWAVIDWSLVNTIPWQANLFDCDDHTEALRHDFRMHGINCCAMVWDDSAHHAFNFLPFSNGEWWFVEPQRDRIVPIGDSIYTLSRGTVVL